MTRLLNLCLCLLLLSCHLTGFSQDSTKKISLLADRIEITAPVGFVRLRTEQIQQKYTGDKRPSEVLTDNDDAYFKIMEMPQRVSPNEVGQYKSFHMSQMKKESNIEWLFDDYQKSANGNWGIIKVIYSSLQRYVHYFFTSMDGKLLLMSFECNAKDWKKYEGIGDAIYRSVKVR